MQVTKSYAGTVALESSTASRALSYGTTATTNVYPSKVNTVNNIIANFLSSECGVDAWYGAKSGSADSFLWIYGVPFLFNILGNTSYAAFYGPLSGNALLNGSDGTSSNVGYNRGLSKLFNGETGTYSFSLIFAGNPNNGFSLRFKTYGSNSISQYFMFRFMKGSNLINGLNAVVWSATSIYSNGSPDIATPLLGGMNGIDLNANGTIKEDSFSTATLSYDPLLHTKAVHKTSNGGALPLLPLRVGPYRMNGIYYRPAGFNLPNSASVTSEIQAEITVSGRSFLITNTDSIGLTHINMGLIETT